MIRDGQRTTRTNRMESLERGVFSRGLKLRKNVTKCGKVLTGGCSSYFAIQDVVLVLIILVLIILVLVILVLIILALIH